MKLSSKKRLIAAGAALAATALLAGCGTSTPEASGSAAATAWALTGGDEQTFRTSFDAWNKDNADAKITPDFFGNDAYKEKIRSAVGSGNAPTLIYSWGGGTLADYVKNKSVADITDSTKDLLSKVIPSVAKNGQVDGKTYAVPNNSMQPVVLWYNKDLLAKVGLQEPPKTWSELMSAVKKFNAAGIAPFAIGGASKWPELMWIEYLTDRIGGPEVFQNIMEGKKDAWSDPAIKEALTDIQDLVAADGFINGWQSVTTDSNADIALVHTGKAAMILQGSWSYPNFKTDAPDFVSSGTLGYTTFPTVDGGTGDPANIVGNPSNYWSVSSAASAGAQKTATDYLNKAIFDSNYVDTLLQGGAIPPIMGLESKIKALPDGDYLSFAYGMATDAPAFTLSWDQALPAAQAQALLTNLDQVFLGQIKPQQFVDAMNATIGS